MGISFTEFVEAKPDLKYIFTGGKGGVGKTVSAAAIAYYFANQGNRVLISSLNPVHSLSTLLNQPLHGGEIIPIQGMKRLYACEVEIEDTVRRYKSQIKDKLTHFLKFADIPIKVDSFVDIATTNPAFEESAQFDTMIELIIEKADEFDVMVFDTAAVANAIRLIGLSKLYEMWLTRMIASREEALSLRLKLSFRKDKIKKEIEKDPLMLDLIQTKKRTDQARTLLRDADQTAFFFVTLPLALPISVVERFIKMVSQFDIPVGGVLVNRVITPEILAGCPIDYLINAYEEQKGYMQMINARLGELVRGHIPLYETEITGIEMVAKVARDLLAS